VAAPRSGKGGQAQAPAPAPEVEAKVAIGELRDRMREGRKAIDGSLAPEFEAAAKRVVKLKAFKDAQLIRVHLNPRTYQVRLAALRAGKKLLVVRKEMYDLLLVDPAKMTSQQYEEAATPSGIKKFGETLDVTSAKIRVDLFLIASMAVDPSSGCRVGPPGSSEELEFGMLQEMGAVVKRTSVVTIADSYALVDGISLGEGALCSKVPADIICTPSSTLTVRNPRRTLKGIDWE